MLGFTALPVVLVDLSRRSTQAYKRAMHVLLPSRELPSAECSRTHFVKHDVFAVLLLPEGIHVVFQGIKERSTPHTHTHTQTLSGILTLEVRTVDCTPQGQEPN